MLPGDKVNFFCKDGLSAATVHNIDLIYNFGGDLQFVDCGAGNILAGLSQAEETMKSLFKKNSHMKMARTKVYDCDKYQAETRDLCEAYNENWKDVEKFSRTEEYQSWLSSHSHIGNFEANF